MNRLLKLGAEALKPHKLRDGGRWLSPVVSKRQANVLRKRAVRSGLYGKLVEDPVTGKMKGWDSAWDVFQAQAPIPRPLRPNKLHKNQRTRADRAEKITIKLGEQAKRMEDLAKSKVKTEDDTPGILGEIRRFNRIARKPTQRR